MAHHETFCFLGLVGGVRAGIQLRSFLGELGCISVSNMFAVPRAHVALDEDGTPKETEEVSYCQVFILPNRGLVK